ncbi:MAG: urate hydroxylase PuuD [Planctomycetes bacterium]|nr:urate hydroxylase PuuD [Planctomycetota bacterium]
MDFDSIIDPLKSDHGQIIFRWFHITAGVIWIVLLYFFNWVNSAFAPTMDGDTKKKVVPELMPRALFWFRWGAAWTWITGMILLITQYYIGDYLQNALRDDVDPTAASSWGLALAGLVVGFLIYDILSKQLSGKLWVNLIAWGAVVCAYGWYIDSALGFPARGVVIHCGSMFGTAMAANVWMRIWPAQKRIISAIKAGEAPDGADVAMAGLRSKHNTFMSVPLLLFMLGPGQAAITGVSQPWLFVAFIMLVGFLVTQRLYNVAAKVEGF